MSIFICGLYKLPGFARPDSRGRLSLRDACCRFSSSVSGAFKSKQTFGQRHVNLLLPEVHTFQKRFREWNLELLCSRLHQQQRSFPRAELLHPEQHQLRDRRRKPCSRSDR